MSHPPSKLALLNDRITLTFYIAIVLACLSFAGMVLGPGGAMEPLLSLAWAFILSAVACLAAKLVLELTLEFQEQASARLQANPAGGERRAFTHPFERTTP